MESQLFAAGLFETLTILAEFQPSFPSSADPAQLKLVADSQFQLGNYRRAMTYYERVLIAVKVKSKTNATATNSHLNASVGFTAVDVDSIRFKFAQCCWQVKEYLLGKQTLMAISAKSKTIQQLLLQAKFHLECQESLMAIECFEYILKKEPMAMEAILGLIDLDIDVIKYLSVLRSKPTSARLIPFILAKISARNLKYNDALMHLRRDSAGFYNNRHVWQTVGSISLKIGDSLGALYAFQQVRKMEPESVEQMDKYAALLKGQSKLVELNRLAHELLSIDDQKPESWIALAHYMHLKGDIERALVYAEKAVRLDKRHQESYQVKGSLLMATGRPTESLICFKKAHKICPDLYTFEGLIHSCLALMMVKEALHVAKEALKLTPNHPRALALVGLVLQRAGETEKARKAYETALLRDPKCIEAIMALCSILCDQKQYVTALQLLERYLPYHCTDWMHVRIGDVHSMCCSNWIKAHHHYQLALSLNPACEKAREGAARVEAMMAKEKSNEQNGTCSDGDGDDDENDGDGDSREEDVDFE